MLKRGQLKVEKWGGRAFLPWAFREGFFKKGTLEGSLKDAEHKVTLESWEGARRQISKVMAHTTMFAGKSLLCSQNYPKGCRECRVSYSCPCCRKVREAKDRPAEAGARGCGQTCWWTLKEGNHTKGCFKQGRTYTQNQAGCAKARLSFGKHF